MKKLLLLATLLPFLSVAQVKDDSRIFEPYIGVQGSLTRVGPTAGFLYRRFEMNLSYDHPMNSTTRRAFASLTTGYVLVNRNIYLTAFAGLAHIPDRFDNIEKEFNDREITIPGHQSFIGGAELGYSRHAGKVFITGRYCEGAFITFGFKVFPLDL